MPIHKFQGCPNRLLVAQHVRSTVNCYECGKPRCIYSKKALTTREGRALRRVLDKYHYSFIRYGLGSLVACTKLLKFSFYNFISLKMMILSQHHLKLVFYIKGYQLVKEKSSISHLWKKIVFRVLLKIMKK